MQDDDNDDDDDDNDDPMILINRAKNHTSERTIVPWTVIFCMVPAAIFKVETSLDAVAAADDQRKQRNIEDGLGWKKICYICSCI